MRVAALRCGEPGRTRRTSAPRYAPAPGGAQKPLSAEEVRLAQNMQVKDAQGAKKRFLQRNAEGRSAISPTVAAALGQIPEDF